MAESFTSLESARLRVVLATVVINIVVVSLLVLAPWSDWRTGLALNLLDNALLIGFSIRYRDKLMPKFILFGLMVGLAELPADAWLVSWTHTLDYSIGGGPMIWKSPVWMPLAWEVVAVQFGYIGLRLSEKFAGRGLLLAGILGAINIPFYEEMAKKIHWWQYDRCRMLLHTPYYIILGEFGIVLVLAILARTLRRGSFPVAFFAGIVGGLLIFACYAVAYLVTDKIF